MSIWERLFGSKQKSSDGVSERPGRKQSGDRMLERHLRRTEEKQLEEFRRQSERNARTASGIGQFFLASSTPSEVAGYRAEKRYVAELMKAVLDNLKANGNDPNNVIMPSANVTDVFTFLPDNLDAIRAAHEDAVKTTTDGNVFNEKQISEILREAAWLVDSLFTTKFRLTFESNGDFVVTPTNLSFQRFGVMRMRVIAGYVEAKGIKVDLDAFVGYLHQQ